MMAMVLRGARPAAAIFHSDRGAQAVFNWSKQHLTMEVLDAGSRSAGTGAGISGADPVAGPTVGGVVRGSGAVLGGDRGRGEDPRCRCRGGRVRARRVSMVPARWLDPQLAPTLSGRYLPSSNREEIALWRAQGCGVREIARRLGRSPSTISRELRRNASTRTYRLDYMASTAQWHAERRARRPKTAKLITNERFRDYLSDKLSGHIRTTGGKRLGPEGPTWDGKNKPRRQDARCAMRKK